MRMVIQLHGAARQWACERAGHSGGTLFHPVNVVAAVRGAVA